MSTTHRDFIQEIILNTILRVFMITHESESNEQSAIIKPPSEDSQNFDVDSTLNIESTSKMPAGQS